MTGWPVGRMEQDKQQPVAPVLPEGYTATAPEDVKKARVFFDRAKTIATTGSYDYAIELYLQGLSLDPDAVEAHIELRDIAMKRKVSGGKDMGMFDKMKYKRASKDDKLNMLNAERLLAYDPGNVDLMQAIFQNAYRGGFYDTVMWIGPIFLRANADQKNPSKEKFIVLRDVYINLKHWKRATDACQYALKLDPEDMELITSMKNLGAQHTMTSGNYEGSGSFRDSVRNMDAQQKLMEADKGVNSVDTLTRNIHEAREDLKLDPTDTLKTMKLVDALVKTEQMEHENHAIELLEGLYKSSDMFRFRHYIGRIKLAQINRTERFLREDLATHPDDPQRRKDLELFQHERLEEELKEYTLWSDNYPTDMGYRYEIGVRMFHLKRFDECIPILQFARQDPKCRQQATTLLARAFLEAGYIDEAVDTLKAQIEEYQVKGDNKAKEMYYWYGRSLEARSEPQAAAKCFSQVAMWDFNYRDVQARLKILRGARQGGQQ
jgi:tetratricopeptide (TPR) repeat protein